MQNIFFFLFIEAEALRVEQTKLSYLLITPPLTDLAPDMVLVTPSYSFPKYQAAILITFTYLVC